MHNNIPKKRNRDYKNKSKHLIVHVRYSIVCPYCLREIQNPDEICIDHEYPRSRFKTTNKVMCCKSCNSEKGALTPAEYKLWKELSDVRNDVWKTLNDIRNGRKK